MSEHVRECWNYEIRAGVRCIALSHDGQFFFAGGLDQHVYCFARSGHLLWRSSVEGIPTCLAVADGCERVLVGCSNGTDSKAYLWNYQQQLLYTFETTGIILGASITPTAHRIALRILQELPTGSLKHSISLFDSTGTLLWVHNPSGFVRRFSITSDGQAVAFGSENHSVYLFNSQGQQEWSYNTGASVWAGAWSADTSAAVVAGSNDYHVYMFGSAGKIRWSYNIGGSVNAIAITPDGRFVGAAGNSKAVFLFNEAGKLLWRYDTTEAIYDLLISDDGRFVLAQSQEDRLTLLDSTGTSLWTQPVQEKIAGIAMTSNGRLLTIAQDTSVALAENLLASEDVSDARLVQLALSQIRQAYGISPYLGITSWFETFDYALLRRELNLCRELLKEVRSSNYQLSTTEQDAVMSREGSLLLYQGLRHQQHGETEQAQRAYEQSQEIQHQLNYQLGEGQALSALHTLQNALDETAPALHALLVNPPELLDSSQTLLARRFSSLSPIEQYQAVPTAKRKAYLAPLLEALSSPYAHIQSTAATALTWLQPGPKTSKLLELLAHPQWIVRWQASYMLSERAKEPLKFAPYRERVRQAVRTYLSQEQDPLVRRALMVLLGRIGDTTYESILLPLLEDMDPSVREATVKTLGVVGTRRVIAPLVRVKEGKDFAGRPIGDVMQLAMQRIRQRYPLTQVQKVIYCQELTEQQRPVKPATRFLTYNPVIHCVVTLTHPTFGTRVSCTVESQGQTPIQQVKYLKFPLLPTGPTDGHHSLRNWLHQLISEEDEAFWAWRDEEDEANGMPVVDVTFSFAPSRGTWSAGVYTVTISLDEDVQYKHAFQVANFEAMMAAPIHYQKGHISHGQKRYQEALVDYEQALKFDPLHIPARCSNGDALIVRGLLQQASDAYSHAMLLDPNAVLAHFCSDGLLHLLELNHYEGILTSISHALLHILDPTIQIGPCPLLTYLFKAAELALLESKEHAFILIEEVIQGVPSSLPDYFAQAIAFALIKRKEDALAALDRSLLLIPNSAVAPVVKAIGLALLEQSDEALAILDQALSLAPNSLSLSVAKAMVSMLLTRKEDALAIIDQTLRTDPGFSLLYIFRGFLLFQLDRREEILATSERLLRLDPDSPLASLLKGAALLLLEREEGLAIIKQVIDTTPDFLLAHFLGAVALSRRDHPQEALTISEQIIQRLPTFAFAYFLQGQNFMALKQYTDAVSAYNRAIQLGLNFDRIYKRKGEALSHLMRFEEALTAYEWAIQLYTNSAVYHSDKGNILIKLGRYSEALEAYEEAIRLDPSYTHAYQGKTTSLEHLGRLQETEQTAKKVQ